MARARPDRRSRAQERAEYTEPVDPPLPGYAGIGITLRAARERSGASVGAVATALRVQAAHLSAIEQGRFGELPGQVYAIGFVRSYAEHLGFDGEAAVRRLKEEMVGEQARQARLTFPVPVGEARTPGPRLVIFALVVAAGIYGAWAYWGRVTTGALELVPPLPERLAKLLNESRAPAVAVPAMPSTPPSATLAPRPSEPASPAPMPPPAVAFKPTPAAPAPAALPLPPPVAAVSPPIAAPAPAQVAAPVPPMVPTPDVAALPPLPPPLPVAPVIAQAPVGAEVAPPRPPAPPPVVAAAAPPAIPTVPAEPAGAAPTGQVFGVVPAESRITLRAKSISWVQVRSGDNEILITRTLRAGDTYLLPNRPDLVMMTGSAGGLEVLVDGKPIPPLGSVGEVRRNIPLDPERLAKLGGQ